MGQFHRVANRTQGFYAIGRLAPEYFSMMLLFAGVCKGGILWPF